MKGLHVLLGVTALGGMAYCLGRLLGLLPGALRIGSVDLELSVLLAAMIFPFAVACARMTAVGINADSNGSGAEKHLFAQRWLMIWKRFPVSASICLLCVACALLMAAPQFLLSGKLQERPGTIFVGSPRS